MKTITSIQIEGLATPLSNRVPNNYTPLPEESDETFLLRVRMDLWKMHIECNCICEGEKKGEVIILVDPIQDGECG